MIETFNHTTYRDTLTLHTGLCLSPQPQSYGSNVFEVTVNLDGLLIEDVDVTREMLDEQIFPGDNGDNHGADILRFEDMDQDGDTHTTYRLMTEAALNAIVGIQHSMP